MTSRGAALYQLAADALVVLHLLFILFVICGGLLAFRYRKWLFVHLPAALWAAIVEFTGWYCPLTPLENWLRLQGGEAGYPSSFIERYLLPLLYPASLTRGLQITLGLAVVILNALVYYRLYRRYCPAPGRKLREPPAPGPENSGPGTP